MTKQEGKCQEKKVEILWKSCPLPCHRKPERSLVVRKKQCPVCYRCMMMYGGYFFIPLFYFCSFDQYLLVGILMNLPMVIDGWTQRKKWRTSTNVLRVFTGGLSGIGQAFIVLAVSKWLTDFFFL